MKHRLIATTAIAAIVASSASGQTTSEATAALGETWDQETVNAFFDDGDSKTLRSESDIQSGWGELSAAEQAKVRTDCLNLDEQASTDGAPGAMDADGPATGVPAADTDVADAGGPDVPTNELEAGDAENAGAANAGAERATTADGGPLGSDQIGAAAGSDRGTATINTGDVTAGEGAEQTTGTEVSTDGADGEVDTTGSAEAVALDVAETDWQKLCEIIAQAEEL